MIYSISYVLCEDAQCTFVKIKKIHRQQRVVKTCACFHLHGEAVIAYNGLRICLTILMVSTFPPVKHFGYEQFSGMERCCNLGRAWFYSHSILALCFTG